MSHPKSQVVSYKAETAVDPYRAVKPGTAENQVVEGAANTDRCIGISANSLADGQVAAGSVVEVFMPGGGGKMILGETVAKGDDLVSHTDGSGVKPNAEGDQIIARALKAGVAGDVIPVIVYLATAHAAQ